MCKEKDTKFYNFDYESGVFINDSGIENPTLDNCTLHPNCEGCIESGGECNKCLLYACDSEEDYHNQIMGRR